MQRSESNPSAQRHADAIETVAMAPPLDALLLRSFAAYFVVWMLFLGITAVNYRVGGPGSASLHVLLQVLLAAGLVYVPIRLLLERDLLVERAISFHWDNDGITLDRGRQDCHLIPWAEVAPVDARRNCMFSRSGKMISLYSFPDYQDFGIAEAIERSEVAPEAVRQAFQASRAAVSLPQAFRIAVIVGLGWVIGIYMAIGLEMLSGWLAGVIALLGFLVLIGYCAITGNLPNRSGEVDVKHEATPNE